MVNDYDFQHKSFARDTHQFVTLYYGIEPKMWSETGVMVKRHTCHSEDLGSNHNTNKLTKYEFSQKGFSSPMGPEITNSAFFTEI